MYGTELCTFSFWWIVPVVMMTLCFFMMRGRRGTMMMSGFGCCGRDRRQAKGTESSMDILDRRYASGDIDKTEYEEKKRTLTGPVEPKQSA